MKKAFQMRAVLQACLAVELSGGAHDAASLHIVAKFIGSDYKWVQVEAFFKVVNILEELVKWGARALAMPSQSS